MQRVMTRMMETKLQTRAIDRYRIICNPIAPFAIIQRADDAIEATWIENELTQLSSLTQDEHMLDDLAVRIEAYLHGEAADFSDVPTPRGGGFFAQCWQACRAIPRGEVRTYAQLARSAGGSAAAARAAGQSMRRNPLPVIVPCHRVVGSAGGPRGLHGYGGSVDPRGVQLSIKRALLELEGAID